MTTINKAQEQTLQNVRVSLKSPVFSHWQFYVASLKTGNQDALKYATKPQEGDPLRSTANIVYIKVLLHEDFIDYNEDQNLQ